MSETNQQIRLVARPSGTPEPSVWDLTTEPVPTPGKGEFVVQISHISVDPAMRGWMIDMPSSIPPVELGAVMRAFWRPLTVPPPVAAVTAGDVA